MAMFIQPISPIQTLDVNSQAQAVGNSNAAENSIFRSAAGCGQVPETEKIANQGS